MAAPTSLLSRLEAVASTGARLLSIIGLVALMILAFITLANGLLRWLLNQPIAGVVDVGALAIAIAVSCCMPVALMERSHIAFRLMSSLSPAVGRICDAIADILVALVLIGMAWQFWVYAGELLVSGERTYVLKIPSAPFWYAADVILWMAVAAQFLVVAIDIAYVAGKHSAPQRLGH